MKNVKIFELYLRILKKQVWIYAVYFAIFLGVIVTVKEKDLISYYQYACMAIYIIVLLGISSVTAVTSNVGLNLRQKAAPIRIELLELRYIGTDVLILIFIWMMFLWTAVILYGEIAYSLKGILYATDLFVVSLVALALGIFVGNFFKTFQGRFAAANFIAFGLPILGGVFSFIPEKEHLLSSFTPIFWYQKALEEASGNIEQYFYYIGIEFIFAVAIVAFEMVLIKQKKQQL